MKDLVFLKNEQALTTSLKVAEYFEKRHDNVIRDIETIIQQMASVSQPSILRNAQMFVKTNYQAEDGGRRYPMYLMNRDGFTLLAMGFTGKKALKFKLDYIKAFNAMEQILLNHRNEEWRAIRRAGKEGQKRMCAVIKQYLLPLAREQGYDKPDNLIYMNYNKAINKAAGVKPKSRDQQPLGQLYEIEKMQSIVEVSVKGLAARGDFYKQIYCDTKQTLENYSQLSFIPQRFLDV